MAGYLRPAWAGTPQHDIEFEFVEKGAVKRKWAFPHDGRDHVVEEKFP